MPTLLSYYLMRSIVQTHMTQNNTLFPKICQDNLEIKDTACFVDRLHDKDLGPDVLDKADIQELTGFDIGMPYGDTLGLQAVAPSWWKSCTKQA
jgi:hypothetical protein